MESIRTPPPPPVVLTFAASDPSGGAGIQADLMAISSLGCHPLSVITALTVQDSIGIKGVMPIAPDWVEDQARTILEDIPAAVFKIGLTGSVENITVIARILSDYPDVPLVFDPVLASGRGDELASANMLSAIQELLLPRTTVLTPNSLEARRLAITPDEQSSGRDLPLDECARRLTGAGCEYVLLTGTHEETPRVVNDLYYRGGLIRSDTWERLPGSYHGSGCTLASSVAACLARGLPVSDAVREAQTYTWQALAAGFRPGNGQFIPDRFFRTHQAEAHDGE